MKKLLALTLALVMSLSLISCSSSSSSASDSAEEQPLRAALLLDGPIDDGGWNADCYNGIVLCEELLGYEIAYSENLDQADFVSAAREYAADGYDLVILSGNQFQDAASEIYESFPDTHFAGINFGFTADNVSSMTFNNVQAGFLAGAFAALLSETGSIGYIGGTEITSVVDSSEGFILGAQYINPDIKVSSAMTGSWTDVAKGKELALAQISTANADVIFGFASACNTGMIAACKESGALYITEPLDILDSEPGVIAGSVLLKNSELMVIIAEMVSMGVTTGQSITGDVSNNILCYGTFDDEIVTPEMQEVLAELSAGLIDGSIEMGA